MLYLLGKEINEFCNLYLIRITCYTRTIINNKKENKRKINSKRILH